MATSHTAKDFSNNLIAVPGFTRAYSAVAQIAMEDLEENILKQTQFYQILTIFNSYHPKLQFTLEIEKTKLTF